MEETKPPGCPTRRRPPAESFEDTHFSVLLKKSHFVEKWQRKTVAKNEEFLTSSAMLPMQRVRNIAVADFSVEEKDAVAEFVLKGKIQTSTFSEFPAEQDLIRALRSVLATG